MRKVMFVCSGGGHLAEMSRLMELFDTYQTILILERQKYKTGLNITEHYLPKGSRTERLRYVWVFMQMCILSLWYFYRFQPDVVVTTGAHTAVPLCYIAAFHNKKVIFIESIARVRSKSLTGQLIEKKCTHIIVQWETMLEVYEKAVYIGTLL